MKIHTTPFRSWLLHRNYSASTIKNYLADIGKFETFINATNPQTKDPFDTNLISTYLSSLTSKSSYKRYLASLKKFCQFALDQKVISTNPIKKAINPNIKDTIKPHQDQTSQILDQFSIYLKNQHKSASTVRNYLVDIQQFLTWNT